MSERADIPLTTIRRKTSTRTTITVNFGADRTYDLDIIIDPTYLCDDDIAADGVGRPSARITLGGLNEDDSDGDMEVRLTRSMGEDELRAAGKALLTAAGKLRRIESARRRRTKGGAACE